MDILSQRLHDSVRHTAAWLRSQTWELPAGQSHTEGHLYNFPVLFFTILMRNMQQNIHQIDTDGGTVFQMCFCVRGMITGSLKGGTPAGC